jgi:hypothetical protein
VKSRKKLKNAISCQAINSSQERAWRASIQLFFQKYFSVGGAKLLKQFCVLLYIYTFYRKSTMYCAGNLNTLLFN